MVYHRTGYNLFHFLPLYWKVHMSDMESSTSLPWYQNIAWVPVITLLVIPICGLISAFWIPLRPQTAIFSFLYLISVTLSVTAGSWFNILSNLIFDSSLGYHRLWSHRSYTASVPLRVGLAIFSAAAMQGPIRWWAREHCVHHWYTDTPDDPYNIKKGFLHAHILWMLVKQPKRAAWVDISDLKANTVVV
jgi:stearoyl-CoA desaturase (delta-9 desaturase)